jgi:hypothetical protein
MKNLIKLSLVFISVSTLFSSCESNLSLTKRHYTSGYYVDYSKNTKTTTPKANETASQTRLPAATTVTNISSKQNEASKSSVSLAATKVSSMLTTTKNMLPKTNLRPIAKQNSTSGFITINSPSKEANPILTESPTITNQVTDGGGERAALSLLWLVIVIILVLWLIGLLAGGFGLGAFINLLLLIALILLILWLCRII